MADSSVVYRSPYAGSVALLVTRQSKSIAVGPGFSQRLQMSVMEYADSNTRSVSGPASCKSVEVIRRTARLRAERCLQRFEGIVPYVIASAGGLVPHPVLPSSVCEFEVLYFIDAQRQLRLEVTEATQEQSYRRATVRSWDAVVSFADCVNFPSQTLTVQSASPVGDSVAFNGLTTMTELRRAFHAAIDRSQNRAAIIATDFRAHLNPNRMQVIRSLADRMAARLAVVCPACGTPGWGPISLKQKFPQSYHLHQLEAFNRHVLACTRCQHVEQAAGLARSLPRRALAER